MNAKMLANVFTSRLGRVGLIASKHSPTLMFGAGVVGVITTVVLASKATLKLDEVLDETQHIRAKVEVVTHPQYTEEDRKRDLTLVYAQSAIKVAKLYAPAVCVGALSIAALTGAHVVLTRRNVGLTAAYAALDQGFKKYRARVVQELGAEKDREFRYDMVEKAIVEETEEGPVVKTVKQIRPDGDYSPYAVEFSKDTSTSWQHEHMYNQMFIQCQQQYANDLLRSRGHVFLNEILDSLGLPRTRAGAVVGWVKNSGGDEYIDFGVFKNDTFMGQTFVNGDERSIILDFNVDGVIYDKI